MHRSRSESQIELADALEGRAARLGISADVADRGVLVPRAVRARDGALEWSDRAPGFDELALRGNEPLLPGSRLTEEALPRFIKLWDASDTTIVAFARRFGVLGVDWYGRPNAEPETVTYPDETYLGISRTRTSGATTKQAPATKPRGASINRLLANRRPVPVLWHREPLRYWRDWSLIVRLLFSLGMQLRNAPRQLDVELLLRRWQITLPPYVGDSDARWYLSEPMFLAATMAYANPTSDDAAPASLEQQRRELGGWLRELIGIGRSQLYVEWRGGDRPTVGVAPDTLGLSVWLRERVLRPNLVLDDVVLQLLAALTGNTTYNVCSECGTPYPCLRRRGYCPDCRQQHRNATKRATWGSHPEYGSKRRGRPRQ